MASGPVGLSRVRRRALQPGAGVPARGGGGPRAASPRALRRGGRGRRLARPRTRDSGSVIIDWRCSMRLVPALILLATLIGCTRSNGLYVPSSDDGGTV